MVYGGLGGSWVGMDFDDSLCVLIMLLPSTEVNSGYKYRFRYDDRRLQELMQRLDKWHIC